MSSNMQILSQIAAAGPKGQANSKSTTSSKPAASKDQALDFMQLLQLMTSNQDLTQQAAGLTSWNNNTYTGNAAEQGNDVASGNSTLANQSVISDINPEIMQLLQLMTGNQDLTQQAAGSISWNNNTYTRNADEQGKDVTLENSTFANESVIADINPEIMQLLQTIVSNKDVIQQAVDPVSWNNNTYSGNADEQGKDVTLENSTLANQSVISDINPEIMQLLQAILSQGDEQSLNKVIPDTVKQALEQDPKLVNFLNYPGIGNNPNLLPELVAVAGEKQFTGDIPPFYDIGGTTGSLLQKGTATADVLSLIQNNNQNQNQNQNLNPNPNQIIAADNPIQKNVLASGLLSDQKIDMKLADYLTGKPEVESKTLLPHIGGITNKPALERLIKNQPVVEALPKQINLTGLAKESSIAVVNNAIQLNLKSQPESMGVGLPQQGTAAGLAQAVEGKISNAILSVSKANSTVFGVTPQQSNVAVAPVNVTADSGAKHEGQQFTQQDPGTQTAVSGLGTFSVKSSEEGIIQQLRVNDNSFVSRFAEIIKGHNGKDPAGQTHIKLQLQPESLGQVIIKLVFKDGNISTQIQATTEHAKQIIENSLPQLRETLANFHLNLQNASVTVGGESGGNSKWGREWNQGGNNNSQGNQLKNESDDIKDVDGQLNQSDVINRNQLNYFI